MSSESNCENAARNQVTGTFESDGKTGGRLRDPQANYRIRPHDPVLPKELAIRTGLRGGETIEGLAASPSTAKNGPAKVLKQLTTINGLVPDDYIETKPFEELTAIDPQEQLRFETPDGSPSMRVVDLLTPIGLGQRGLIVAPPRTGKTILLQQMAHGVATNRPDAYMMVLLIDERPEEVTDMRRNVNGEVVASSNDSDPASHVRIARLMIQKAKRMVECGRDVVILLDSLTRLGRAFNRQVRNSGRIMSGGLDIGALAEPKAIFGAARNLENGGSLTIIASALIDTGSRMDQVIFNEFKGTGNMEMMLSREMANRRLWPAIDLDQSGTRKEELLLSPQALEVSYAIRRRFLGRGPVQAMEQLLNAMGRHSTNDEFVKNFDDLAFR
jgi:transcription termination factor Rho